MDARRQKDDGEGGEGVRVKAEDPGRQPLPVPATGTSFLMFDLAN